LLTLFLVFDQFGFLGAPLIAGYLLIVIRLIALNTDKPKPRRQDRRQVGE
jgi:hypothetical protein